MKDLLIGKSADPEIQQAIHEHISSDSRIADVFNIITIQIGPYIMLAAKIKLKETSDTRSACEAINALERSLKKQVPDIKWSFIEPDITN